MNTRPKGTRQRLSAHPFRAFSVQPGTRLIDGISNERRERLCAPEPAEPAPAWLDVVANNQGFYSRFDYPCNTLDDHDNPFIVGVFGGSVAQLVALQVGARIADELAGTAVVDQRPPLILNCASGG